MDAKSTSRRFDGHKMDLVTDEASELILGVDVRAGNATDGGGAMPLVDQVTATPGVTIATVVGDMAYSDGDIRAGMAQRGLDLVAKVPPVSNAGRYPKTDFYVDLDAGEVTCPAGETTAEAAPRRDHKGRPGLLFRFDPLECASCPLRADCTTGAGGRTIFVGPHHQRIQAARSAQQQPRIKTLLRNRSKIERKNRPSPGPGHAQSPLPGPTQNQTSRLDGRHCGQHLPSRHPRRPRLTHPPQAGRLSGPAHFADTHHKRPPGHYQASPTHTSQFSGPAAHPKDPPTPNPKSGTSCRLT